MTRDLTRVGTRKARVCWWPSKNLHRLLLILAYAFGVLVGSNTPPRSAPQTDGATPAAAEEGVHVPNPKTPDNEFVLRLLHLTRGDLAELSKQWLAITKPMVQAAAKINIELSTAKGTDADKLRSDLDVALRDRNQMFRKFGYILSAWESKGGKTDQIEEYRQYISAILQTEFELTDWITIRKLFLDWWNSPDGATKVGIWLLSLVSSLLGAVVIAWFLARLARDTVFRMSRMSYLLRDFLSRVAFWIILFVGILTVLSLFGFKMTPILAAFGGASFVIAFATQSTLSNLASGLLLMITKPFDVGDHVNLAGVSGKVQNVSTVSTTIVTPDNETIVVPNTKVWDTVIVNLEGSKPRGLD